MCLNACLLYICAWQTDHSVRESEPRTGAIRRTPRLNNNFRMIDNQRKPELTKKLLTLEETGTQAAREELLWALRCIREASAGVGQQLPCSEGVFQQARAAATQPTGSADVTEVIVLDDSEDEHEVIDVSTYLVEVPTTLSHSLTTSLTSMCAVVVQKHNFLFK